MSDKQKKEERKKNKNLEKELREYEDSMMNGNAPEAAMSRKSPDSSPEVPRPKRIRTEVINVDSGKDAGVKETCTVIQSAAVRNLQTSTGLNTSMTTAYTETSRDNANLMAITKDPLSIRPSGHQSTGPKITETSGHPAPSAWINQGTSNVAVTARVELNPRLIPKPVMTKSVMTNVINLTAERAPGS
jgi:hypothetical protein